MTNHYETIGDDTIIEVWHRYDKMHAVIDTAELPRLLACNVHWYASLARKSKTKYYVFAKLRNPKPVTTISLHRIIMNDPEGLDVHHKDNDGLNNRRSNLEACAHKKNVRERRPDADWQAYDANQERIRIFKRLVGIGNTIGLTRQAMFKIRNGSSLSPAAMEYWLKVSHDMPELFPSDEDRAQPWINGPSLTSKFYLRKSKGFSNYQKNTSGHLRG